MTQQQKNIVPEALAEAAVSILRLYCPELATQILEDCLRGHASTSEETLYTRCEIATKTKLSVPTIDRMIASGELPHCKIRRSVRISEADLREFIASRRA